MQAGLDPEGVALFQLSGGTTGVPKVIPHSHVSYTSAARRWGRNLGWDERTVALHFLPVMHHAGLCTALLPAHLVGGGAVLARAVDAEMIEALVARHRVAWLHFNLAAFEPLAALASGRPCDFSSITHVSWTFVRPELSGRAEELLGATVVGSFGMGEGVHLSARRDDPAEVRRFTVGSTIGEFDEVRILAPGHARTRSPTARSASCASRARASSGATTGTPRSTPPRSRPTATCAAATSARRRRSPGGAASRSPAGSRTRSAGAARSSWRPSSSCCSSSTRGRRRWRRSGIPDPGLGERVGVFVVPAAGGRRRATPRRSGRSWSRFLDERQVAKFKWPERLYVLDALPRTAINKVKKDELRAMVGTRAGARPDEHEARRTASVASTTWRT